MTRNIFEMLRGIFSNMMRAVSVFTKRMKRKVSKLVPVILMIALVLVVASPWASAGKQEPVASEHLTFARDQIVPLKLNPAFQQLAVEVGPSKTDLERMIKTQKVAAVVAVKPSASDVSFEQKRALAQRAAAAYGVPWEIVEAVWQVESGKSWDTGKSSYAGATGPMQFMPGTWRTYGVDANGDGVASISTAEDAVFGGTALLAANGAADGDVHRALFAYNHSDAYVNKVLGVARSIGYGG